ncbi:hypothetical protein SynBIOSU31_01080 [Synechococcus sp. BIOS-U3-1]|nr:hypothetical protein SynBIOSU31_01080 [Synechococcus sp. BIOS-U3-1]
MLLSSFQGLWRPWSILLKLCNPVLGCSKEQSHLLLEDNNLARPLS